MLSTDGADQQTQHDHYIQMVAENGRMGWQKTTGYGRRSLVETAIGRYKHLLVWALRARSLTSSARQDGDCPPSTESHDPWREAMLGSRHVIRWLCKQP